VPYEPGHDYYSFAETDRVRTTHLALDLAVDFERRRLEGSATLQLERLDPTLTQVVLDTRDLSILDAHVSLPGADTQWRAHFHLGERHPLLGRPLVVEFPEGFDPEKDFELTVAYATNPDASALQWLPPALTAGGEHPLMFSQSQAIHARSWVPLQDSPAVRITYEATVRTPQDMRAVMSADNDPDTPRDGEYHFEMPQPIPSYLLAIAAGDLHFEALGEDTGVYTEPALLEASAWEFAGTQDMLDMAEKRFGPYDWGRYDLLILPPAFPYGGMENPRLSFITSSVLAGDRSLVSLIAHELAHSWSGNLVTNRTWRDIWLNEGTTSYLEARLMEALYGEERADEERVLAWLGLKADLERVPERFQALAPAEVRPKDGESPQQGMQYPKGQFFLEHMERLFGRERFDPFMQSYFKAFAWQSITTEDFLEYLDENLLSAYPGVYSRAQAEEWLYGPGIPDDFEPPVSASLEAAADAARRFAREGADLDDWDTASWSPQATVQFIEALPADASDAELAAADAHFGFSDNGNVAITRAWFTRVAESRFEAAYPALEEHLARYGRMFLVVPVYRALAENGADASLARGLFAKYRDSYHPITQGAVTRVIDPQ
jgi:aminopeptidase N